MQPQSLQRAWFPQESPLGPGKQARCEGGGREWFNRLFNFIDHSLHRILGVVQILNALDIKPRMLEHYCYDAMHLGSWAICGVSSGVAVQMGDQQALFTQYFSGGYVNNGYQTENGFETEDCEGYRKMIEEFRKPSH
ncbi:hypothetical protein C0992_005363 [Termitomyces sp. T32_za158]|nr:hypothetical protein C0992_005363 [Termitomyces sp. T32_za158]